MTGRSRHWSEDRYWTDALDRFAEAREKGLKTLTINLDAFLEVAALGDGPSYRLMDAMYQMVSDESEMAMGYRGAPRVLSALLMRLHELGHSVDGGSR